MSRRGTFAVAIIVLCLSSVWLASPVAGSISALQVGDAVGWGESVSQEPEPEVPCNPVASRVVQPLVVGVDGTVDIQVDFDWTCSEKNQAFDFYLVVENSSYLEPSGWGGRQLAGNLRDGLHDFVLRMDYTIGSRGGLILYASNEKETAALEGGTGGQQHLISGIRNISPGASRSARANGEAVQLARERLTAANTPTDTKQLILLVDAGAPMTQAKVDVFEACQAAKDAGILMSVYALKEAGDRLSACADEGLFRGASRDSGEDISDDMQRLGEGLSKGKQAERLMLADQLSQQFDYVEGSGRPEEPAHFLHDLSWEILPPPPEGGHRYEYQVSVAEGYVGEIVPLSKIAGLSLFYMDGTFAEVPLESPEICIYPPGHEDFCDKFVMTLTPPAPTEPPTETPTVTPEGPGETPTPDATDTPDVVDFKAYLPVTANSAEF